MVTIRVDTSGFGGKSLKKTATVLTNDPAAPKSVLTMEGEVEAFAVINPPYLRLYGKTGEKISGEVTITPSDKYEFRIVDAKPLKGDNIQVKFEQNSKEDASGYLIKVDNTMEEKGRYYDTIHIKTDSEIKPLLTVKIYGNIFEKPDQTGQPQPQKKN
jgi:hypothetical protein